MLAIFQGIERYTKEHERKCTEADISKQLIIKLEDELNVIPSRLTLLEKVRTFLQTLAEATRDEIMKGLEEIVTRCLQSVFGAHLRFEIEVETKRNNTGIEFFVIDESVQPTLRTTPDESLGGGVIDVIAVGLRFGLLKVLHPAPEGPILLDEPAKMVSGDLVESIALLLQELSDIFDRQIILVTHHQTIVDRLDNTIFIQRKEGATIAERGR